MRNAGRITDWNDARGYGFVVPNGGGDRAFVHVKEFQRGSRRPMNGDSISYLTIADQRGRLNAKQIRYAGQTVNERVSALRLPRVAIGITALLTGAGLAVVGVIPMLLQLLLVGLSLLAYVFYWLDKSAAQRGARRTPESTLHLISLAGGWPGALVAQQQFRHKTIKQPFQSFFWATVAINVAAIVWLVKSGVAAELARSLSG